MNLLDWIKENRPGTVSERADRIEVAHDCGEHSTLWFNKDKECLHPILGLGIFQDYDGVDLFSSTFKVASLKKPKVRDGVQITFALKDIEKELLDLGASLPEKVTPFMIQQGMGIYSIGADSGKIYEWDTELNELTGEFSNFYDILSQWLEAVEG